MSHSSKGNPDDVSGVAGKSKQEKNENGWMVEVLPQKLESIVNNLQSKDYDFDIEIGNLSTEMSLDMINKLADDADLMTKISKRRYIHELVLVRCMRDVYQQKESSSDELSQLSGKLVRCLYMAYKIIDKHSKPFKEDELDNIKTILGDMLKLPSFERVDAQKKNIIKAVYQDFLDSIDDSLDRANTSTTQARGQTKPEGRPRTTRTTEPTPYLKNLLLQEQVDSCRSRKSLREACRQLEELNCWPQNKLKLVLMLIETYPHTAKRVKMHMKKVQEKVDRFDLPNSEDLTVLTDYYKKEKKYVRAMAITLCIHQASKGDLKTCASNIITGMMESSSEKVKHGTPSMLAILNSIQEPIMLEKEPRIAKYPVYLSLMGLIACIEHAIEEKGSTTLAIKEDSTRESLEALAIKVKAMQIQEGKMEDGKDAKEEKKSGIENAESMKTYVETDEQKYEDYTEPEPETADVSDKVQNELEKLEAIFAQKMKIPATKTETIGSAGGNIRLHECSIDFPVDALKQDIDITMSVNTDPDQYPEDCIPLSPILGLKASMNLCKSVDVEIPLNVCIGNSPVQLDLMYRNKKTDTWVVSQSITLSNTKVARFRLSHFSSYSFFGMLKTMRDFIAGTDFILHIVVYIQRSTASIVSLFCKNNKIQSDYIDALHSLNYAPFSLPFAVVVTLTDKIKTQLTPKNPPGITLEIPQTEIEINEEFLRIQKEACHFSVSNMPEEFEGIISFEYLLERKKVNKEYKKNCELTLKKEWPITVEQKSLEKSDKRKIEAGLNLGPVTAKCTSEQSQSSKSN